MLKISYIKFPIYSFCLVLSIVINFTVTYKMLKIKGIEQRFIVPLIIYQIIGVIFGAKILSMLTSISSIKEISFDRILKSGFSSYGGLIGELIITAIFILVYKIDWRKTFEATILGIPLMYAISKLGCLFAGCCYGFSYDGFLSISYQNYPYDYWNGSVFPVQLCESIVFFIIFIVLIKLFLSKFHNLEVPICFVLCAIAKFSLDFLRARENVHIISTNQIISLVFIVIGIVMIFYRIKQK